ncbi:MAG: sigma-70 family RNA polymerase sigma factor [Geitlerinemataceae cyanobacterium]
MPPELSSHPGSSESHQSDAELIALLQGGQTNALGVLYSRHAGLVYGVALQVLGDAYEAEDLTQDIFLSLIRKGGYDPKRGALRTFLAVLTRSRAIDRRRSQTRTQARLRKQVAEERAEDGYDRLVEDEVERSQEVQAALAQLSSQEREVLKMAYYEGLSQSKIATRLDLSLGTVKSRSRRALLKLRQALSSFRERS